MSLPSFLSSHNEPTLNSPFANSAPAESIGQAAPSKGTNPVVAGLPHKNARSACVKSEAVFERVVLANKFQSEVITHSTDNPRLEFLPDQPAQPIFECAEGGGGVLLPGLVFWQEYWSFATDLELFQCHTPATLPDLAHPIQAVVQFPKSSVKQELDDGIWQAFSWLKNRAAVFSVEDASKEVLLKSRIN
jgi:hypothetical protein